MSHRWNMAAPATDSEFADQARDALVKCVEEVPFLRILEVKSEVEGMDIRLRLQTPAGERLIVAEIKNIGQPRIIRTGIKHLRLFPRFYPTAYLVVVAPYISEESADLCRREGVGYVDLAGNCYLCFEPVFISKEGKANLFARKRDLRSLYSPKAERVLRVLLSAPSRGWKVEPLAKEARVSLGQAFNVSKLLRDREWAEVAENGFMLTEPSKLLAEWSENYDSRRSTFQEFRTSMAAAEFEKHLADACRGAGLGYALAGFSSAARYLPNVHHERVSAYVKFGIDMLAERLRLEQVSSGGNVELIIPNDSHVLYGAEPKSGFEVTSPVQTYLDLRQMKGMGEEIADLFKLGVIQPRWLEIASVVELRATPSAETDVVQGDKDISLEDRPETLRGTATPEIEERGIHPEAFFRD